MMSMLQRRRAIGMASLLTLVCAVGATTVSAETLMMPKRDMLMGTAEVVWGVTSQANGTNYTIDFGDGVVTPSTPVADRSYIAVNHAYTAPGTYTATLTVGVESATVEIRVYNPAALSAAELRGLNINRTIQNGLRYLWTSQNSRAAGFPATATTSWPGGFSASATALVVAAFQNHGYRLTNDNVAPTGLYEKYVVRRGLNFVLASLSPLTIGPQTAGNPCVGLGAAPDPCTAFFLSGDSAYQTPVGLIALAGSGAADRVNSEVAGITAGKTFREIIQRMTNAVSWGQNENGNGRGGWQYNLNNQSNSDGSTVGWVLLGLLDAEAAGAVIPAFVRTEFALALNTSHNTNGSLDYQSDGNPGSLSLVGIEKGGIPLQGAYFLGDTLPFPAGSRTEATLTYISDRWTSSRIGGDYNWGCQVNASPIAAVNQHNFGCAYSMFNVFKGLGLYGIANLPGVGDWYGQYQDWLVANQTSPTSTAGGNWGTMQFSCCESSQSMMAAVAELILSPVVLIQPDPGLFSTVGLSPATATNPVGTDHTVTATTQSSGGAPVPGVTINFQVLTGPNAGKTGSSSTNAQGQTTFTYTDTGGPGTDTIQAFYGQNGSNVVEKIWQSVVTRCDADSDGDVDSADLLIIRNANRQNASSATDPRDGNGDGKINVADVRYCQLRCTRAGCAQ